MRISGVVTYRARVALPAGAIVRVRLEDVARQDAAATVIAETETVTAGEQVPIAFALDVELADLPEHARLALRATVEVEGRPWFVTTTQVPLPDDPTGIELVVEPAAKAAPPLGGTEWELVELGDAPAEAVEGARPHLVLDLEESHVSGSGGCNRLTGSFALAEGELRFGPIATTRMACPEPIMQREQAFLRALAQTSGFVLEDGTLSLLAGERVVARLAARAGAAGD